MINPYEVLKVIQNATKTEIQNAFVKAQLENVKTKKFDGKDLMEARNQLMNPAKRLVADFLFPSKFKTKRPKLIDLNRLEVDELIDFNDLNVDALDSLKNCQNYV
jgi:hypothetical protein